jgi:hypothetical protein
VIRDYAKAHKIILGEWTVTDTGTLTFVSGISNRAQARRLSEFLTSHDYLATVFLGNRQAGTWSITARPWQVGQAEVDVE